MNPQFKRNLVGVAVASCFAGTAYGNPIGPAVVNGSVGFGTAGKTLTVTNSPGAIINWQSFSIAADEATRFIQQSAASSVLNRVVGGDPSLIFGLLQSNGRVFVINPNGLLFGATARIDVPGFVASTLDISNADFLNGRFNFAETTGAAGIKNEGSITTSTGGFVYLVATDIENSGIITSPQGEVILAAGKSVELVNSGSPDIRVVLTAPDNQAINVGSLVAKSGRIGIYGGLISQQGTVNANTVVRGKNGEIIFKATKDITLDPGSVTTASGEGRGVKDGGEIRIIADGTLNVKAGSEVHVDGGPNGGDGGFLELSGKQGMALNGAYTGAAKKAGYRGGELLLDPLDIEIVTGGLGLPPGTSAEAPLQIDPVNLDYGGFANVTLLATNNLSVLSPIADNDILAGGSLTLQAGNSILVAGQIGTTSDPFDHDLNLAAGVGGVGINASVLIGNANDLTINTLGPAGIQAVAGPVEVTARDIKVSAFVLGVMGGSGPGQSVKVSAGNDINLDLSGSTCIIAECGAFGVIGGTGNGAFAEVTAGNDIKIRATDSFSANAAVWGGGGSGAYAKLRAGRDIVLDLQPSPSSTESFGGGWLDVFASGGGNNAYAEASAGRNIESKTLTPDGYGGLIIGAPTTIGGVIVEGGSAFGPYGGSTDIAAGNITATLSAGYDAAGVPRTDGQGSIALDLAYGMEVLGGEVDHFLDGAEGSPSISTDASALMRAAKNITLTVAGTGGPAVMIEGGSAFAGVTNAASGTAIASATADATVLAYGGAASITVTNGGINLSGGDAAAEAFHSGAGTANHQATAQAKTKISAATNVTLDAQNGTVNVNGGIAGAHAGHDASDATGTFSGDDTATATTGLEIKGGAASTVSLHGAYGANIDAGYGGAFAFKYQAASGVTMSGANTASAYGGLSISGGSISITTDSGPINIFAPAALAIATHWLDNASGANVTGNNKAYAEFNLALTASGAASIEIDAGANSVQLGGGSSIYVDDFPQPFWLPRGAMALAQHNVIGGSDNSLSGNNDATAKAATSFLASAGPVTILGGSVNLYGAPTLAVAAQQAMPSSFGAPALKATLSGNDTAAATGSFAISGYGGVSITGTNNVGIFGDSASASAFQHVDTNHSTVLAANQASSLTGVQTAGAASSFSIAAPNGSLSIAAPSGVVTIDEGEGDANAHQFAQENNGSTGPTLSHTLSGSQSATGAASITLSAKNNLAISAFGGVNIYGDDARARAYQDAYTSHPSTSGGAFVGHTLTAASQSAIATNSLSFSGTTVAMSTGAGSIWINGGSADASAYQQAEGYNAYGGVTGHQLTVGTPTTPATQSATATNGLTITATGGGITISAPNGWASISGSSANADAWQQASLNNYDASGAMGAGHVLIGNQSATANNTLSLSATGDVQITTGLGADVGLSEGAWASASQYASENRGGYGGTLGHKLTGNQSANAATNFTISGANITVDGGYGGVNVNNSGASADASQDAYTNNNGAYGGVSGHTLTGNQNATANAKVKLTATGNITLVSPYGGNVSVYGSSASASASQYANIYDNGIGGTGHKLSGNQTTNAASAIELTAGGTLILSAANGSVNIAYFDASASAQKSAYTNHYGANGDFTGSTLSGNQTATATSSVKLSGANVSVSGAYGARISASYTSASAYQSAQGDNAYGAVVGHKLTGDTTASAEASVEITATGGNLSIASAYGGISISASSAYAEGSQYASLSDQGTGGAGHSISGNNNANATSTLKLSATGALTLSAYGSVYISADRAYAWNSQGAYTNHYGSNGANAGYGGFAGHTVSGNQTMMAKSSVSLSGATVDVTAAYGGVYIYGGEASASNYQYGEGYNNYGAMAGHSVTGNLTSTATGELTISATGGINLSAPNGSVYVSASSASASAEQWAWLYNYEATGKGGTGHTVSGTLTPTATANLTISAGGNVTINAAYGAYIDGSEARASASQYAYSWASSTYGGALGHSLTGTITAKATNNLTVSGANITLNGGYGGVEISASSASASAEKNAYAYNYGAYGGVKGSTLAGNVAATADSKVKLSATGNITLSAAYGGNVYVSGSSASASASQYAYIYDNGIGGTGHTFTGNSTVKAASTLELTAGGTLTLSAANGSVYIDGSDASALASQDAYTNHSGLSGNFAGSTLSGSPSATATSSVSLSGANINVNGANGVYISGSWAEASASQSAGGYNAYGAVVGHQLTDSPTANALSEVKLTAGASLSIASAYGGISISGSSAWANASQEAYLNGVPGAATTHTVSGNPKADAKSSIVLSAGTSDLTLQAYGGGVGIYGDDASASASQYGYDGAKLSGGVSATGASEIKLSAGGNIKLYGNYIDIVGSDADAYANQSASGVATNVSGTVKGTAVTELTLAATGKLELTATGGGVNIFNSDASAFAYQEVYGVYGGGVGTTLSGANTAEANSRLKISAGGDLTISGPYASVSATSGSASAYQYVNGEKATVSGTNTAKASVDITVSAGGNLTVTAPGGLSVDGGSWGYYASAYQDVYGSNHTVSGANTAVMNAKVALTAGGTMTIAGGGLDLSPGYASAYAYRSLSSGNTVSGTNSANAESSMKVSAGSLTVTSGDVGVNGYSANAYTRGTGDNRATAKSTATLSAGSLAVAGGSLYVNGGSAYASHSGTGAGAPAADASATVNSGVVNVSGDVYLNGGNAYTFTSGTGAPKADANASILMGAGDKTMTVGGSLNLYGGFTDFTGAGIPSAYALIDPGQLTITTGGNVHLIGGDGVNTSAGLHAFGPIVLNIGGSELELFGGPGSGLFAGTGSNITVSFTSSAGTIIVDNTCSFCGDAFVRTEPTGFAFTPPPELFRPQQAPETPDDKKKTTVSGDDDQRGTQEEAPEDEGLPTCS